MSWLTPFEDPIALPNGQLLHTLKDAADYITILPVEEFGLAPWQAAMEALISCSQGSDAQLARLAFLKALNREFILTFNVDGTEARRRKRTPQKGH